MCGQGGVAGSITISDETVFKRLLVFNSLRGIDSTGAASVKRSSVGNQVEMVTAKEIGNPYELMSIHRDNQHDFTDVLKGSHRALLGHCRSKTMGAATRKNAHPFMFDNIVGTHNGTLGYQGYQKLPGYSVYDTDSEALFHSIETRGVKETIEDLSSHCAYALVWYDSRDNTINFLRNKERPLFYMFDEDSKRLYWSSEWEHLLAATKDVKSKQNAIKTLEEHIHLSWVIPEINQTFGKAKATKREPLIRPFVQRTGTTTFHGTGGRLVCNNHNETAWYDDNQVTKPWLDDQFCLWCRYNHVLNEYEWSAYEKGSYGSIEQAWDNLSNTTKDSLKEQNRIPPAVKVRMASRAIVINKKTETEVVGLDATKIKVKEKRWATTIEEYREKNKLNILSPIYADADQKAYFNLKENKFDVFKWEGFTLNKGWQKLTCWPCPKSIPLPVHDINARHFYKHLGKKKNKKVFYKGYRGNLIPQKKFNEVMECGCEECKRIPQWGNQVLFLSSSQFLCEFCNMAVPVKTKYLELFKKSS